MGMAPLAAKAAVDEEIAKGVGMQFKSGLGNAAMDLYDNAPAQGSKGIHAFVPYEERLSKAVKWIKAFGLPKEVEYKLRDDAKQCYHLDADIACKQSWSMSVKLMTQRERNYQKALNRMIKASELDDNRTTLSKLLGFDWPW
jgi:hypothetical protein